MVTVDWEHLVLDCEWVSNRIYLHILFILFVIFKVCRNFLIFNSLTGVPVESEEVLKWLVNSELESPLQGDLHGLLNKEKVVAGKC